MKTQSKIQSIPKVFTGWIRSGKKEPLLHRGSYRLKIKNDKLVYIKGYFLPSEYNKPSEDEYDEFFDFNNKASKEHY